LGWEGEWDVEDYSQGPNSGTLKERMRADGGEVEEVDKPVVLARSRRPALLVYRSWMTELAYRFLRLPLYVLGFGKESEKVVVRMMEGVEFEKGWRNVPSSVKLEVRSKTPLEVYKVNIRFAAKLEGLRWVMYTHRLASFTVFTALFWSVEMGLVLFTWAVFSFCLATGTQDTEDNISDNEGRRKIKDESGATTPKTELPDSEPQTPLSDSSRTFPTLPSHKPLHYSSSSENRFKEERSTPGMEDVPVKTEVEADDEDDDFLLDEAALRGSGGVEDSGLGTSMESGVERSGVARRRSGGGGRKKER
jgi:seipin